MGPKILDRYVFRQLIPPFLGGLLGAMVITSFGHLLRGVQLAVGGQAPKLVILEWFAYRITEDMQFIFPVAVLLATLLTFGRMSKDSEIVSIRAAGISLVRIMFPVAFFGILVTAGVFLFLDRVVPPAMRISQELWEQKIRKYATPTYRDNVLLKSAAMRSDEERLVYAGRVNLNTGDLERVTITDYRCLPSGERERLQQTVAVKAQHDDQGVWVLDRARTHTFVRGGNEAFQVDRSFYFDKRPIRLSETPEDFMREERKPKEQSFTELLEEINRLERRGMANTTPMRVELYLKLSFPCCILIFSVLGAAMGVSSQRSGPFIGFGLSLIVTFLYYLAMSVSSSLGKTGILDPWVSVWIHNILFSVIAMGFVLKAQR